jgi:hypothetical protein
MSVEMNAASRKRLRRALPGSLAGLRPAEGQDRCRQQRKHAGFLQSGFARLLEANRMQ